MPAKLCSFWSFSGRIHYLFHAAYGGCHSSLTGSLVPPISASVATRPSPSRYVCYPLYQIGGTVTGSFPCLVLKVEIFQSTKVKCVCVCVCVCVQLLQSCSTLQPQCIVAPLSMGFSWQEYWNVFLCPPPGDLPDPGLNPCLLCVSCTASRFFTVESTGKPYV